MAANSCYSYDICDKIYQFFIIVMPSSHSFLGGRNSYFKLPTQLNLDPDQIQTHTDNKIRWSTCNFNHVLVVAI